MEMKNVGESNYLNIEQTARYLNLKLSQLRYLVFTKRVPYIKIGALLRFDREVIEEWVQSNSFIPREDVTRGERL